MKVTVDKVEVECTRFVELEFNGIKFRLSKSVDGKLKINKTVIDFDNRELKECVCVFPRVTNEVELL